MVKIGRMPIKIPTINRGGTISPKKGLSIKITDLGPGQLSILTIQEFKPDQISKLSVIIPESGEFRAPTGVKPLKDSLSPQVIKMADRLTKLVEQRLKIKISNILCDAAGRLAILTAEPDFIERIISSGKIEVLKHRIILKMVNKNTGILYFLKNIENKRNYFLKR